MMGGGGEEYQLIKMENKHSEIIGQRPRLKETGLQPVSRPVELVH